MRRSRAFTVLTLLFAGCVPRPFEHPASDGRTAIAALTHQIDSLTRRMDTPALLALWDEDGVSLLPNAKPMRGKHAIAAFLDEVTTQTPEARMITFELRCFDLVVSGPWASEWCTEHQIVRLSADRTFDGRGKLLYVFHRGADGRWRISREMWNQGSQANTSTGSDVQ